MKWWTFFFAFKNTLDDDLHAFLRYCLTSVLMTVKRGKLCVTHSVYS